MFALPYTLIYSMRLSNGLILALLAVTILNVVVVTKNWNIEKGDRLYFLLSIILFVTSLCGLIYTKDTRSGLSLLESRLPLLIFPIIFYYKKPDFGLRQAFIRHFLASLVVTFFVVVCIAVYRNIKGPGPYGWFNKYYYHYSDLTEPIDIDPLYISLFVGFGVLVLFMEQLGLSQYGLFKKEKYRVIVLVILCTFLVIIGVRSILIFTLCIIFLFVIKSWIARPSGDYFVIYLLTGGIIALSFISPITKERFQGLFNSKFEFSDFTVDRFIIWSVALHSIEDDPTVYIFGNGTGSSEMVMDKQFRKEEIAWDFKKKVDTHNQYIEFILDTGFTGALILIAFLGISMVVFFQADDRLGFIFVLMIALALLNENFLNRQKGLVFFSVFYSLFLFTRNRKNLKPST